MRPKTYTVTLSDDEQARLRQMLRGGSHKARTLTRVRILLHAHEGTQDKEIVTALETSMSTVGRVRKQYANAGLDAALYEAPRPGASRTLDGVREAYLVHWRAVTRPKGGGSGRCNCWRTNWSRWEWWKRSRTRRYGAR